MCARFLVWACLSHNAFAYIDVNEIIGSNKKKVLASILYSAMGSGAPTRPTGGALGRPMGGNPPRALQQNQRGPNAHNPGQLRRRVDQSDGRGYTEIDHPGNRGHRSDRRGYLIDPSNRGPQPDPSGYFEIDHPMHIGADEKGDFFDQRWGLGPEGMVVPPPDMEVDFMGGEPWAGLHGLHGPQDMEVGFMDTNQFDRRPWANEGFYPDGADPYEPHMGPMGPFEHLGGPGEYQFPGDY